MISGRQAYVRCENVEANMYSELMVDSLVPAIHYDSHLLRRK